MTTSAKKADLERHPSEPTAWARFVSSIIAYATSRGADHGRLVHGLPLPAERLADPDHRVPLSALYTLVERAADATDPLWFAVDFARNVEVEMFDAIGFLMATSPTIGEAFERTLAYQRIWADGERFDMAFDDGVASIRYRPCGPSRAAHRLCAEMALFDIGLNSGQLCGKPLPLTRLRLRHPGPPDAKAYAEVIGCEVELNAPVDELTFDADALSWKLTGANAAMNAYFQRHAQRQLDAMPVSKRLTDRVQGLITERLERGAPTLDDLAQQLGMSSRTLQRKLRAEGTSVHVLLEAIRRERAAAFLDTRMAIAEIAYLLGYSEPSAFHRAFKRWTGQTPDQHRQP